MIKLSVMEEIETNIDDIIDSCEHLDVYNMHNFICEGMPIETIFEACDKLQDSE